ncbi:spermidine synthase [Hyphomonas adhaerens]|uniref:spermidine synthase n=1 Tax=Hyphomonas adhaerens TaxID=81029 RepID=UPI00235217ED|nr:fused MFS/spermidine synthase [Hyphomonas adhaerens]
MQTVQTAGATLARRAGAAPFIATIFLSAGLVFLVQPMFAKMATPLLGGAPAVWNVSLVCFQAALLAGYAYAHLLARAQNVKLQIGVHALFLLLASFCLPLSISGFLGTPDTTRPTLWLIGTFAISIAPPFAVISATAPLVQSWYARSGRPDAADPYHLYAASNAGSLIGLAAYPLLMEPFTRLGAQTEIWSLGYLVLAVLLIGCGLMTADTGAQVASPQPEAATSHPAASQSVWKERITWLTLSAGPSALLVGVTSHISTDVASAPFLWAPPLMVYIGTFIIVFSTRPAIAHKTALTYMPFAVAMAAMMIIGTGIAEFDLLTSLVTHILALFFVALALHGELANRRPDARRLTEFYLLMSLGGVLGSAFSSLLAPVIFDGVYEYPLLLCVALLLIPSSDTWRRAWQRDRVPLAGIAAIAILTIAVSATDIVLPQVVIFAGAAICLLAAIFLRARRLVPAAATAAAFILAGASHANHVVAGERGFFGMVRAIDINGENLRIMAHGTTNHGSQRLHETGGHPTPLTYYHAEAPIGQVFTALAPELDTVGVVGLGVGSVACYRQPGQTYSFFEIDPVVVHMAKDPSLFTFLSDCAPDERIVLGDARITLGDEPAGEFDLLLLDAFSSDAIPAHLLTREAMALYLSRLSDDGIILFHISNRHMNLAPVVARTGASEGAAMLQQFFVSNPDDPAQEGASSSLVVMLARTPEALDRFRADPRWTPLEADSGRPWSDDYSNIVGTLYESHFGRYPIPRAVTVTDGK